MGRVADRQGFDLETSIHHVKSFVRDRCADVRGFLKLDKRIRPEDNALLTSSTPSSEPLTATGRHAPGVSKGQHAHDVPLHSFTGTSAQPYVTREELGRSTWLFLHTLAAQYPDRPSKQHRKDVNTLVDVLTRIYPCGECAEHFQAIVRDHAPNTQSGPQLRQWMCQAHNAVNRSLGKPEFNCQLVDARWKGVECEGETACTLFDSSRRS